MQIDFDIGRFKVAKDAKRTNNARAEIIGNITDKINREREAGGWKYKAGDKWKKLDPITPRGIAVMCSKYKGLWDLGIFYRECEKADSFSRFFFYSLKTKKCEKK